MIKAYLFDIDGTLADCQHRVHHVQNGRKDWKAFFDAMPDDPPIVPVVELYNRLWYAPDHGTAMIVVTARPDDYLEQTKHWLIKHIGGYDRLYMRKAGDYRADAIVKKEILDQIRADGYDPVLVVDDRTQVVNMWRENGIMCLQAAPDGTEQSTYAGQELFHMLIGPTAAGKSTYCRANYKPIDVISTDEIREQFGWGHTTEDLAKTFGYVHGLIKTRLEQGIFTVLDATNLRRRDRLEVLRHVPRGIRVRYLVFDRALQDKLRDRDWRPEHLVTRYDQRFRSGLRDILTGDGLEHVVVEDCRYSQ